MRLIKEVQKGAAIGLVALTTAASGCCNYMERWNHWSPLPPPPAPLGDISSTYWRLQEHHGEASDFVIYVHEFKMDSARLNYAGEDHVKQIAARLLAGAPFPVLIERHTYRVDQESDYKVPTHLDPELDMKRREMIVQALMALHVPDADQRVIVSPALAWPYEDGEAQRAYYQGLSNSGLGAGGLGGAGFGFGGFGGGGFF